MDEMENESKIDCMLKGPLNNRVWRNSIVVLETYALNKIRLNG